MPRHIKQDGKIVPDVITVSSWIVLPVKATTTALDLETYLVPRRVADYIVKLEKRVKGKLPKLPAKK